MLDEEAKSEEELAEAQAELAALESKVKKQDETYKAEKASLEAAMAEKVGLWCGREEREKGGLGQSEGGEGKGGGRVY